MQTTSFTNPNFPRIVTYEKGNISLLKKCIGEETLKTVNEEYVTANKYVHIVPFEVVDAVKSNPKYEIPNKEGAITTIELSEEKKEITVQPIGETGEVFEPQHYTPQAMKTDVSGKRPMAELFSPSPANRKKFLKEVPRTPLYKPREEEFAAPAPVVKAEPVAATPARAIHSPPPQTPINQPIPTSQQGTEVAERSRKSTPKKSGGKRSTSVPVEHTPEKTSGLTRALNRMLTESAIPLTKQQANLKGFEDIFILRLNAAFIRAREQKEEGQYVELPNPDALYIEVLRDWIVSRLKDYGVLHRDLPLNTISNSILSNQVDTFIQKAKDDLINRDIIDYLPPEGYNARREMMELIKPIEVESSPEYEAPVEAFDRKVEEEIFENQPPSASPLPPRTTTVEQEQQLQQFIYELSEKNVEMQTALQKKFEYITQLEQAIQERDMALQNVVSQGQQQVHHYEHSFSTRETQIQQMQHSIDELHRALEHQQQENVKLQTEIFDARVSKNILEKNIEAADEEIRDLKEQVRTAGEMNKHLYVEKGTVSSTNEGLQKQIFDMSAHMAHLEQELKQKTDQLEVELKKVSSPPPPPPPPPPEAPPIAELPKPAPKPAPKPSTQPAEGFEEEEEEEEPERLPFEERMLREPMEEDVREPTVKKTWGDLARERPPKPPAEIISPVDIDMDSYPQRQHGKPGNKYRLHTVLFPLSYNAAFNKDRRFVNENLKNMGYKPKVVERNKQLFDKYSVFKPFYSNMELHH